jgi:DNA-binding NarL/FixJ family response regulator
MSRTEPIRILLADDHRMFREGVKALLTRAGFEIVAEADDGREVLRLARRAQPDIAVLDIGMPELNGIGAARELARTCPNTRIVFLTMHDEEPYLVECLRAGARAFIVKREAAVQLVEALRQVAQDELYLSPGLSRALVDSYRRGHEPPADPLTRREREVLQLIAEGKTNKGIAAALVISSKTVESHRQRLMAKLDLHDTASLVRYAIRNRVIEA